MFQTQYLLSFENLNNLQMQYFEEEDFVTCSNIKRFVMATEILKNRILFKGFIYIFSSSISISKDSSFSLATEIT